MIYALVSNGVVQNMILWDGQEPYDIPNDADAIHVGENDYVGPGFSYDGEKFTPPQPAAE